MKITVLTAVKNSVCTIEESIRSVIAQEGVDIEYIVLDGMSSDGTSDIISRYRGHITQLVTEEDRGLYHALNKGISVSTGDIVAILHADDFFADSCSLKKVADAFSSSGVSIVYGNIDIISSKNTEKVFRRWKCRPFSMKTLKLGWCPPHTAFYARREMYEKYGCFNTDYEISADYDLMLRFLTAAGENSRFIDETLVKMRTGGMSRNTGSSVVKKLHEDYDIIKRFKLLGPITLIAKRLRKLRQFQL